MVTLHLRRHREKAGEQEEVLRALEGRTLLLPIVSTGNVGQLCADLLISAGGEKVGNLSSNCVLPACGYETYPGQERRLLVTKLELFLLDSVAIVQQRAPVRRGDEERFVNDILHWAKGAGIAEVVLLTGAEPEAAVLADGDLAANALFCYRMAGSTCHAYDKLRAAGCLEFHLPLSANQMSGPSLLTREAMGLTDDDAHWGVEDDHHEDEGSGQFPQGMGITKHFARSAAELPVAALILPVSEGDNAPHAQAMAWAVGGALGLALPAEGAAWKTPESWNFAFGGPRTADSESMWCY
jgi:proteasome assembly chaperone 2